MDKGGAKAERGYSGPVRGTAQNRRFCLQYTTTNENVEDLKHCFIIRANEDVTRVTLSCLTHCQTCTGGYY